MPSPIPSNDALAGFTTVQLLAEVANRMDAQNSDKGRELGDLCKAATSNLDGGVLGYRRDPDGSVVLDANDLLVWNRAFQLAEAVRRFLGRVDVVKVLTLLDMQRGGCDVLDDLRALHEAMSEARTTRRENARAAAGQGPG
jgi:hypothetical protein